MISTTSSTCAGFSEHEPDDGIDWSLTTWEGSRRATLRDWMKLSLTEKWAAVEEMADFARARRTTRFVPAIVNRNFRPATG